MVSSVGSIPRGVDTPAAHPGTPIIRPVRDSRKVMVRAIIALGLAGVAASASLIGNHEETSSGRSSTPAVTPGASPSPDPACTDARDGLGSIFAATQGIRRSAFQSTAILLPSPGQSIPAPAPLTPLQLYRRAIEAASDLLVQRAKLGALPRVTALEPTRSLLDSAIGQNLQAFETLAGDGATLGLSNRQQIAVANDLQEATRLLDEAGNELRTIICPPAA
jgi:hypothetical protein